MTNSVFFFWPISNGIARACVWRRTRRSDSLRRRVRARCSLDCVFSVPTKRNGGGRPSRRDRTAIVVAYVRPRPATRAVRSDGVVGRASRRTTYLRGVPVVRDSTAARRERTAHTAWGVPPPPPLRRRKTPADTQTKRFFGIDLPCDLPASLWSGHVLVICGGHKNTFN